MFAYNLVSYASQAIESVLAQRAPFDYELVIGDDCSTDGTRELLVQYARAEPQRIRLVLPERRLGGGGVPLFAEVFRSARAEYVAYCDCDDFWTVRDKLARQVDFLDNHPGCAISFHDCVVLGPDGKFDPANYTPSATPPVSTIDALWRANFIASCSALIRRTALPTLPHWYANVRWGDWARYILAAQHGDIGYIPDQMGTYRLRPDGEWAGLSRRSQIQSSIDFLKSMDRHLDFRYKRPIRIGVAHMQLDLADLLWNSGQHWPAREHLIRGWWGLRASPTAPRARIKKMIDAMLIPNSGSRS